MLLKGQLSCLRISDLKGVEVWGHECPWDRAADQRKGRSGSQLTEDFKASLPLSPGTCSEMLEGASPALELISHVLKVVY